MIIGCLNIAYSKQMEYVIISSTCEEYLSTRIAHNVQELNTFVAKAVPGDTIYIANGIWKDAEVVLEASGSVSAPIYVMAQTKGQVVFEGQSYFKLGGEYLHLEGLVFKNGFTPVSSVISFQKDKHTPCNNCRVTECVIDNYNPSERFDTDYWVEMYGKFNRFDHNYLVGKRNRGVTLAVRLKNERDRENQNRIDHNHFGFRPTLGSNGGETLRIGTSHYSLSNSNTLVENNYFEHCSGELEIISSKSCQNQFKNNTFYECQGTLTMRHGNETWVEGNYFFGNRIPHTGGIRVINESQTVKNNFLHGLTGTRFRGALVIMNGVPNSPLNRYFQVKDSEVSGNILIDSDHIQLCAGSDKERSATPETTSFKNNIIYNRSRDEVFTVYDNIDGIKFEGNILSPNIAYPSFENKIMEAGFKHLNLDTNNPNVYNYTINGDVLVGPTPKKEMPTAKNTGVRWYPKKSYMKPFKSGKHIQVAPGENTLIDAIKMSEEGDVLELESGQYHLTKSIKISHNISIVSNSGIKPKITFERSPLFSLENGGSLELEGVSVSGKESDDYSGNAVIRTSRYSMINNYKLLVRSCDFTDLNVNHSFNFLKVYKNTFADSILLSNCKFKNISGHVLNMDKEIDDAGIYNAENVIIENCQFNNIGGSAVKLYRGGKDESTFGPLLWIRDSSFENIGHDKRNKNESAIHLHGVQYAELSNLSIKDSRKIHLHLIVGDPVIKLKDIELVGSEEIISNSEAYSQKNVMIK